MRFYSDILSKIEKRTFKVISFDIFDTLLFRFVDHPHKIFDEVGKKASKSKLLHHSITSLEFALLRLGAEQEARKDQFERNGHNEVTLDQIYEFLPKCIGDSDAIQSLEVKTECEFCYINPEILNLIEDVNRRNLPVVLIRICTWTNPTQKNSEFQWI